MKKTVKLSALLCTLLAAVAALTFLCIPASAAGSEPAPPKMYIIPAGGSTDIYLDGVTKDYLADIAKKQDICDGKPSGYLLIAFLETADGIVYEFDFEIDKNAKLSSTDCGLARVTKEGLFETTDKFSLGTYSLNSGKLTKGVVLHIYAPDYASDIAKIGECESMRISGHNEYGEYDYVRAQEWRALKISPLATDISTLDIAAIPDKSYNGKARRPEAAIKDGDYTLVRGTDYTLSYKNNTDIGTATVTIKGKGAYSGRKTVKFKIVPPKTSLAAKKSGGKYRLSWNPVEGIDKYQIYYSSDGGKTFGKLSNIKASKTGCTAKLDASGTYIFRIRSYKTVDGKKYYSSWSEDAAA